MQFWPRLKNPQFKHHVFGRPLAPGIDSPAQRPQYTEDIELEDAVHTAILTLKEGFEGQISGKNIEIGIVGADRKFRVLTPAEVDDYLAEVE